MSSTNHTTAATPLRAFTGPAKKVSDADDLARAESEGMIADRTPPTPPTRRERAKLLLSRVQARATLLARSVRARVRAVFSGSDKRAPGADVSLITPSKRNPL